MARTMLHGHAYDGSRATRDLGLVYTPAEDTPPSSLHMGGCRGAGWAATTAAASA